MRIPAGLAVAALALAAGLQPAPAHAGLYGDDLAKCLVERTSDADKILLAQWIYTVISVHPSVASLGKISDADREAVAERAGKVFETLLTDSCGEPAAKAIKYEGTGALGNGFKVLGEIAMTTLLGNPRVSAESENFVKYVDQAKIKAALEGSGAGD
jgi:hypothetical protein